MESRVTRCPHCQTAFRVTDNQLAVADGKVRCGSCLHVFVAADHWSSNQESPLPADAVTEPDEDSIAAAPVDDDLGFDDDELLIDDTSELAALDDEEENQQPQPPPSNDMDLSESFLRAGVDSEGGADLFRELQEIADDLESDDEQWARQLLEDSDDEEDDREAPTASDRTVHRPRHESDEPAEEVAPAGDDLPFVERWLAGGDDGAADKAFPEDDALLAARDEQPRDDDLERMGGRRERLVDPTPPRGTAGTLPPIEDEPLVLSTEPSLGPGMRQLLWGVAALAAGLVATGQYGWHHRNELAGDPIARPFYATVCRTLGCTLPPRDDIGRIRSSNLVVRNHPRHAGALSVDAILTNIAPFEQPWPRLLVQFSDLHGKPEAARVFTPGEYLGGEAAGRKLMPSRRPVHISLTVVDPGPDAVNYQISLLPPGNS